MYYVGLETPACVMVLLKIKKFSTFNYFKNFSTYNLPLTPVTQANLKKEVEGKSVIYRYRSEDSKYPGYSYIGSAKISPIPQNLLDINEEKNTKVEVQKAKLKIKQIKDSSFKTIQRAINLTDKTRNKNLQELIKKVGLENIKLDILFIDIPENNSEFKNKYIELKNLLNPNLNIISHLDYIPHNSFPVEGKIKTERPLSEETKKKISLSILSRNSQTVTLYPTTKFVDSTPKALKPIKEHYPNYMPLYLNSIQKLNLSEEKINLLLNNVIIKYNKLLSDDPQFLYYFTGLFEGDGFICIKNTGELNLEITFKENNLALVQYIISKLGTGVILSKKTIKLIISDIEGLYLIYKILNGRMLTPKHFQLKDLILWLDIKFNSLIPLDYYDINHNIAPQDNSWLAGFIEAGCTFYIGMPAKFELSLGIERFKFDQIITPQLADFGPIMELIASGFDSHSTIAKREDGGRSRETHMIKISSTHKLMNLVVPYLDKFPLKGIKLLDYFDWKKGLQIFFDINIPIESRNMQLLNIKNGMNSKRIIKKI